MAVIVCQNENAGRQFMRAYPLTPCIEGGIGACIVGPANIEGGAAPRRVAFCKPWAEVDIDWIRSVIARNSAEAFVEVVDELPGDWEAASP